MTEEIVNTDVEVSPHTTPLTTKGMAVRRDLLRRIQDEMLQRYHYKLL